MRQAVSRTRETFSSKIADIAALTRTVDESALEELETALLTSDLGVETTTAILDALRDRARHQAIEGGAELRDLLKAQLQAILEAPQRPVPRPAAPPKVTFLVGVNGTGKTTSSGKLAAWSRAQGHSVLLCAADTFRAAAIEQLEVWAARSNVEMINQAGRRSHGRALRRDYCGKGAQNRRAVCQYRRPPAHQNRPHGRAGQDATHRLPPRSRCAPRGSARHGRHHGAK